MNRVQVEVMLAQFKLKVLLILTASLLSVQVFAQAQTENVNFFIPPNETGGFGDLMTNIWMAKKIKASHPDLNVSVFVDPTFKNILKKIFDSSIEEKDSSKSIDGITFHFPSEVSAKKIPGTLPETCNVSFSLNALQTYNGAKKSFLRNIRKGSLLIFDEYGYDHLDDDLPSFLSTHVKDIFKFTNPDLKGKPTAIFRTGPSRAGLYISKTDENPGKPSKADLLSLVKKELAIADSESFTDGNTMLGYSYTDQKDSALTYITAMAKFAELPENSEKNIVLMVRTKADWKLGELVLPKNLIIRTFESMPFDKTQIYLGGVDLPSMVTGDMSATQALDKGKLFFYEELNHKTLFIRQLNHELEGTGKVEANPVITFVPKAKSSEPNLGVSQQLKAHYERAKLTTKIRRQKKFKHLTEEDKGKLDRKYMSHTVHKMFSVLKNRKEATSNFSAAVEDLRKDASLPDKFLDICRLAAENGKAEDYLALTTEVLRKGRLDSLKKEVREVKEVKEEKACLPELFVVESPSMSAEKLKFMISFLKYALSRAQFNILPASFKF